LQSPLNAARDVVRAGLQHGSPNPRAESRFKQMCAAALADATGTAPNRLNSNRALLGRTLTELIPMPDIQIDRAQLAPSILPTGVPELSDDECVARLARAVDTPDSARLDEVAALIGRLAVTIE